MCSFDDSQAIAQEYHSMGGFVVGNVFPCPKVISSLLAMKCYRHVQCYIFFISWRQLCAFAKERWPHLVAALSNLKKEMFFLSFKSFLHFRLNKILMTEKLVIKSKLCNSKFTDLLGWSNWTGGRLLSLLLLCECGCVKFWQKLELVSVSGSGPSWLSRYLPLSVSGWR